jgi:hypothetical protein
MKIQKSIRVVYFLVASLVAPHGLLSQNCEAILGSVRDTTEYSVSQGSYYSFKRFFCDQTFSSYQQARDSGLKLGVVLDDLPISIEGHDRSSSWSQYQHSLCESIDAQSSSYLAIQSKVVTANANVVNAWTSCINQSGVHFFAEANFTDPTLVTFVATYNGLQTVYEAPVNGPLQWVPSTALACDAGKQIGKQRKDKHGNTFYIINNQRSSLTCTRVGSDDALPAGSVTLKTSADDRVVQLAGYSPPPVIKEVPTNATKNCSLADNQIANDGVLGPGTTHRFGVGCDTDGNIVSYAVSCVGPCSHAYRDAGIAAQDQYYNNHHGISAKYYIDDAQPTRSFVLAATYQIMQSVCVAHCKGVSTQIKDLETPVALPQP